MRNAGDGRKQFGTPLGEALCLAAWKHDGQVDKAGQPYILHVMRVVVACPDGDAQVVAALHDLIEDTDYEMEWLEGLFSLDVIEAVDALTRRDGEGYTGYIQRLSRNPLAVTVKLADLRDNLDRSRITLPTQRDLARWDRYEAAFSVLSGKGKL